jgi:CRP-like cAMP-binding protein
VDSEYILPISVVLRRSMNTVIEKIEAFGELSTDEKSLLRAALSDIRSVGLRKDILREGDKPTHVHLLVSGWCCRYNIVADGARQITAFLLQGDVCNSPVTLSRRMNHSIATLTPAKIASITPSDMDDLLSRPSIARALWLANLADANTLRAWIINIGRRDAAGRVAHLLCELFVRHRTAGSARLDGFDFPLTQVEIGDALGLTPVHVNRVMRHLREAGLISIKNRSVDILDLSRLEKASNFNSAYLHVV